MESIEREREWESDPLEIKNKTVYTTQSQEGKCIQNQVLIVINQKTQQYKEHILY